MAECLNKLIDKLSSYQIFNYLFPGILFINLLEYTTSISIPRSRVEYVVFVYYISGMILSRIGSVIIEPLYKGLCWVVFAKYSDFLNAANQDPKVDILSMENNTYRTLISTFLSLLVCYILNLFQWFKDFNDSKISIPVYLFCLIVLFSFAYSKQTSFVRKRSHHIANITDKDEVVTLKEKQKYGWLRRLHK